MKYPLLIQFSGVFKGAGFTAEVSAHGRLVAADDGDDGWWIYGVNPGALSADGPTLDDAHAHVRMALKEIMGLFASESSTFATFKERVEDFFFATNEPSEEEWRAAVDRVRANKETLANLPVGSAAFPVTVTVRPASTPDSTPNNSIVTMQASIAARAA